MGTAGVVVLLVLVGGPGPVVGQAALVWRSDLAVRSLDVTLVGTGSIQVRVVVAGLDDGPARATRLELLLPVGVGVLRMGSGCRPSPASVSNIAGRVTCDLGDLPAHAVREITIVTTLPARGQARYAAVVLSDTPDPAPGNNFVERRAP